MRLFVEWSRGSMARVGLKGLVDTVVDDGEAVKLVER